MNEIIKIKMRELKELLQLVLDKVNEETPRCFGLCYFVESIEEDDIITLEEGSFVVRYIQCNDPREGSDFPEEFRGYDGNLFFFRMGDWDIRRRYLSYLISKL